MTRDLSCAHLLPEVLRLARAAAEEVMAVYASDFSVSTKADESPVTAADHRAEAVLAPGLTALTPGVPVVAEEACAAGLLPVVGDRFWLVDPLDGTREFLQRNGEFTVNVALIEHGVPVLGVVLAPALGEAFAAVDGQAFALQGHSRTLLRCRPAAEPPVVLCSRSHDDRAQLTAFLATRAVSAVAQWLPSGSSLKFARLAAGLADLYPRLTRTMEWDTAAGDALVRAAGGVVQDLHGHTLRYGKPGLANAGFIASGS
jgi:3'(2'), 5'-bisphosphate nucleotidase